VHALARFPDLRRLDARGAPPRDSAHIPCSVEELRVSRYESVLGLSHLRLASLEVDVTAASGPPMLTTHAFAGMTDLRALTITSCPTLGDIGTLAALTNLTSLSLRECWSLRSLDAIRSLTRLESLDVTFATQIEDLPPLPPSLRRVRLYGLRNLAHIEPLSHLPRLVDVDISMCPRIADLERLQLAALGSASLA
jgi:hypothetical protein